MGKIMSLAEQVDVLFQRGRERGLPVTYRAVAEAVGETANNIFRIHHGQNLNPGLRTLSALVEYFQTDLGYFSCKTKANCLHYLNQTVPSKALDKLTLRAKGISPAGIEKILQIVDLVRQVEGIADSQGSGLLLSRTKRIRISRGRRAKSG